MESDAHPSQVCADLIAPATRGLLRTPVVGVVTPKDLLENIDRQPGTIPGATVSRPVPRRRSRSTTCAALRPATPTIPAPG